MLQAVTTGQPGCTGGMGAGRLDSLLGKAEERSAAALGCPSTLASARAGPQGREGRLLAGGGAGGGAGGVRGASSPTGSPTPVTLSSLLCRACWRTLTLRDHSSL